MVSYVEAPSSPSLMTFRIFCVVAAATESLVTKRQRPYLAYLLRLWKAEAPESFNFKMFNEGDYYCAVYQKVVSENLTKVLYPNDEPAVGKQLRLEQQYFFVSCSLQDMIRIHKTASANGLERFHEKFAVQLNDTHPSIAVAELMRLLVDEHGLAVEDVDVIVRHLAVHQQRHALALHGRQRVEAPLDVGDARLGVGGGAGGVEFHAEHAAALPSAGPQADSLSYLRVSLEQVAHALACRLALNGGAH